MLSAVLFLSVLTLSSMSKPQTERGNTSAPTNICEAPCACERRDDILDIYCENKNLTNVQQFHGPLNEICHLFLEGNSLKRLSNNEFINFDNLISSLYLGNNSLEEIQPGAFNGLRILKRLQLNNNVLHRIEEDTLAGLKSLEHLQLDSNSIKVIKPRAFRKLNKLKVLILNNNLLLSLPPNVFRFLPLSHLDLRGNRLTMLPFSGLLEHIGSNVEVQLQENPWNCTCDLIPLQSWLDDLSVSVGDMVCETPSRLHAEDITQLKQQDLCPRRNARERVQPPCRLPPPQHAPPTKAPRVLSPGTEPTSTSPSSSSPSSSSKSSSSVSPTESHIHPPDLHPNVSPSPSILFLPVFFILFFCLMVMLSLLVLEYRRGIQHVSTGTNTLDLNSLQEQNGSNSPEPTQDEASESPAHNNTPPPRGSMCPINMQKDGQQVAIHLRLSSLDVKKEDVLSRGPGADTISSVCFKDKRPTARGVTTLPGMLYQNLGERPNTELPSGARPFNYNACPLPQRPRIVPPYEVATAPRPISNQDRLKESVLDGGPRTSSGPEQPSKHKQQPLTPETEADRGEDLEEPMVGTLV